ncbi:uncharacterized protein TNCV_4587381 [Trichonephila clavipes]|nr:uncharacterized protein TNCV_4587381 [Trichonephila clavipes]
MVGANFSPLPELPSLSPRTCGSCKMVHQYVFRFRFLTTILYIMGGKMDAWTSLVSVLPNILHFFFWEHLEGCGSPVVKVSNHGRHVMSSIPVPLKTRCVGQRCTLNLSRAETPSRWCGVVVRRGGCQLRCRPRHLTMVQNYVVRRQKPSCS